MSEFTPQKWSLYTKIDEFLLTVLVTGIGVLPNVASRWYAVLEKDPLDHCLQMVFRDLGPYRDLFGILGPYLFFRVPIFSVLASFTRRMSI